MKPKNLTDWLDYQQQIHPRSVELGLERVGAVWRRMGAPPPAPVVITVGGTNGKGSTVAFLEAMLIAAGKRVGCFTSPHLLHYNERVRVNGADIDDAALVGAFERIDAARNPDAADSIALTYFEFGTLAALWIFAQSKLDVAVLEVGLGGRLDAVNIIDADAAIVTTIDLDHQDWLGNDRETIGREKAGIFRVNRPAIIGEIDPPHSLLAEAERMGASVMLAGRDFVASKHDADWRWNTVAKPAEFLDVPTPTLAAPAQIDNAAAAIAALYTLRDRLGWSPAAIASGVRSARVPARLQRFARESVVEIIVDVAHNPQAARVLALWMERNPIAGRSFAVFGALSDKDVSGIVQPLAKHFATWHIASLDAETPRGFPAAELLDRMMREIAGADLSPHASVAEALSAADAQAGEGDRIVAFGSFFVAAGALSWIADKSGAIQREALARQV
jgi:dihydrofolate synthase / folylpolyglutamate synthase